MADLYAISNWDDIFENNRSREIKDLNWVAIPNRHDGSKFAELMSHKNGPQHFAAWILIVQVASRVRDSRGILRRGDGSPHTPLSLSFVTRCPESVFSEAIPILFSLGWLKIEGKEQTPHLGAGLPHLGAAGGNRTEQDRTEQNRKEEYARKFEIFWETYPARRGKKVGKKTAFYHFQKIPLESIDRVIANAKNYGVGNELPKDPERFLKNDFWMDWDEPQSAGGVNGNHRRNNKADPNQHRSEKTGREFPEPELRSKTL